MNSQLESLQPIEGRGRSPRHRLTLKAEFMLAIMPTAIVLLVLAFVNVLSEQRLLFASLAASAFLIYVDPEHGINRVRTLIIAQMGAATIGLVAHLTLGSGYIAGGAAMVTAITLMILLDAVHPPAVATSISFAFRAEDASNFLLFGLAVGITCCLVVMQRVTMAQLARYKSRRSTRH